MKNNFQEGVWLTMLLMALCFTAPQSQELSTQITAGDDNPIFMQGLSSTLSDLQKKIQCATTKLLAIKACHEAGNFWRVPASGGQPCCTSALSETCAAGSNSNVDICASTCELPWGGNPLPSGLGVTAYLSSSVPFGSTCQSETRSCNNGALSGSYTAQSCTVGTATTCTLPWGGTINNGQSVTAYSASTMSQAACQSESRTCSNGTLSGSYSAQSCNVTCPASVPPSDLDTVKHVKVWNGSSCVCPSNTVDIMWTYNPPYAYICADATWWYMYQYCSGHWQELAPGEVIPTCIEATPPTEVGG